MAKVGRPTKYTKAIGAEICDRIALGESLIKICADEKFPDRLTVIRWLREGGNKEFHNHYAQAREDQQDFYQESILDISNDDSRDVIYNEFLNNEGEVVRREARSDNTAVQRDKLRVDSLKWTMSKLAPKKYGDKQAVELSGAVQTTAVLEIARSVKKPNG